MIFIYFHVLVSSQFKRQVHAFEHEYDVLSDVLILFDQSCWIQVIGVVRCFTAGCQI
jgi:hypothetical protein